MCWSVNKKAGEMNFEERNAVIAKLIAENLSFYTNNNEEDITEVKEEIDIDDEGEADDYEKKDFDNKRERKHTEKNDNEEEKDSQVENKSRKKSRKRKPQSIVKLKLVNDF